MSASDVSSWSQQDRINQARQDRIDQAQHVDVQDDIPSSMVAEHGSIAEDTAALAEAIRIQAEQVMSTADGDIDAAKVMKSLYEKFNEFMQIEAKKVQVVKALVAKGVQSKQAVFNASAVKEILEHSSGTKSNKDWVVDVSTHKAIQSLSVFNNERSTFSS